MHTPNLKPFITSLVLFLCLHFVTARVDAQETYKIDDAHLRCDFSEVPQITDPPPTPIYAALNDNKDAKAAIVVYGGLGEARRYANHIKEWMTKVRGVNPERLIPMYGGPSNILRLELWLIPRGASSPKFNSIVEDNAATLFDRYTYITGIENWCGAGRVPSLNGFAQALKQHSSWQGYIIIRRDPEEQLSTQAALRLLDRDKRYLTKRFALAPTRIKVMVGNNVDNDRQRTHTELWLVPPGTEPPRAAAKSSIK
jgi:hypothetical protein